MTALGGDALLAEAIAAGTEEEIDEVPATVLTKTFGARDEITVQWFFFRHAPLPIPRAREDGAAILFRLRANAMLPGEVEAKLDRAALQEIPFPEIAETTRRSFAPRQDVALDLAVRSTTNEIVALRLVRARRGNAAIHALAKKT